MHSEWKKIGNGDKNHRHNNQCYNLLPGNQRSSTNRASLVTIGPRSRALDVLQADTDLPNTVSDVIR